MNRWVATLTMGLLASTADAQPDGWFAVEFDPLTTPLGARNVFVHVEPPMISHWTATVGVFAADFPAWMTDILSYRNREKGIDIDVRLSPALVTDYYLEGKRVGWHVGLFNFLWRYEVERGGDRATFTNHVLLPRVGYRWYPQPGRNWYVDPFAGAMFEYTLGGSSRVDGTDVKPTPLLPFASVHLGVHF